MRGRTIGAVPRMGASLRQAPRTLTRSQKEVPVTVTASPALLARHAKAGARYVAAVAELTASLVDLAALERLLPPDSLQSFEAWQPDSLSDLRHRGFLPNPPQDIRAAVALRAAELQAEPA